jgi:hypothetical protein
MIASASLAVLLLPGLAAAQGGGNGGFTDNFAVGPVGAGVGFTYFRFQLDPGGTTTGAISVIGESAQPIALTVFPSLGVTSPNSGDAYLGEPGASCAASACWLQGLPRSITLADHERETVSFTLTVPADAAAGQYLAGVAVQPATLVSPGTGSGSGGSGAESVIARSVVVGVAVTVGSGYPHEIVIPNVVGTRIGSDPGLVVEESDPGRAFEHPQGEVSVEGPQGQMWRFALVSGTVLPGGEAGLRILAPGVPAGSYPASAFLRYDGGGKTARWNGNVTIPAPTAQPVSIGPGTRVVTVPGAAPGWLWALLGILGGLLLIAGGSWPVFLWRRKRRATAETVGDRLGS